MNNYVHNKFRHSLIVFWSTIMFAGIFALPIYADLHIDAAANLHPISPYIYGMSGADESLAEDLRLPVHRSGGNARSRYNWNYNMTNRGSDWYYENTTANISADDFTAQNHRTNTDTLLTIPLIGWVSKNSPTSHPFDCGFKVSKYNYTPQPDPSKPYLPGPVDPYDTDCGTGIKPGNTYVTGNDPLDTSIAITETFATAWINHLISLYDTAANGGVKFYSLDNEPMLWNSTHRDVHPDPTSYDEMRDKTYAYAAAIKAADPGAQTLGPVVWGWVAYFYSALDQTADEWWNTRPDRKAHGDIPFVEWYLQQMQAYEQTYNLRILDYVDVHIYPQIDNVYSSELGNETVQAARLRSTRQLWDRTYKHEDWINDYVYLIPRMHEWVANNYPGTKTAITEYNWGALGYMNGALAQADLLGIFGREGLDLACLWGAPSSAQPGAFAFRMYRNYDGAGSAFGDISVQATSSDQEQLAVYAALRSSDGTLTIMVINKTKQSKEETVTLSHFTSAMSAQVYRYSAANLNTILHLSAQPIGGTSFTTTFPASSITLFVLPGQQQSSAASRLLWTK